MHVSGFNGTSSVFSGTDILSESGVSTGYQSYNGSFDFSGVLNKITVEVGGRDINLAVCPLFDDVTVNVFYNVINTIIEQQITTVEEIVYLNLFNSTELDFATEVFEFNDITVDEGIVEFSPVEPETEEISFESVELEIDYQMTFDVEFAPEPEMVMMPPPEIKMEVPVNVETVEAEIQMELEELPEPEMMASVEDMPEPEMSTPEPEPEEPAPQMEEMKEEPEMVEPEPEEETTEEPQEEPQEAEQKEPQPEEKEKDPEEKPKEEKSSKPKVTKKEKAATKIVKKIDDKARYDDAAQMKTLIVMQILGNTPVSYTHLTLSTILRV